LRRFQIIVDDSVDIDNLIEFEKPSFGRSVCNELIISQILVDVEKTFEFQSSRTKTDRTGF
jgi:hypothetical protein